jgi:hypothetical protein
VWRLPNKVHCFSPLITKSDIQQSWPRCFYWHSFKEEEITLTREFSAYLVCRCADVMYASFVLLFLFSEDLTLLTPPRSVKCSRLLQRNSASLCPLSVITGRGTTVVGQNKLLLLAIWVDPCTVDGWVDRTLPDAVHETVRSTYAVAVISVRR